MKLSKRELPVGSPLFACKRVGSAAAVVLAAAGVENAVVAADQQQDEDDDPPAIVSEHTHTGRITRHIYNLLKEIGGLAPFIP